MFESSKCYLELLLLRNCRKRSPQTGLPICFDCFVFIDGGPFQASGDSFLHYTVFNVRARPFNDERFLFYYFPTRLSSTFLPEFHEVLRSFYANFRERPLTVPIPAVGVFAFAYAVQWQPAVPPAS